MIDSSPMPFSLSRPFTNNLAFVQKEETHGINTVHWLHSFSEFCLVLLPETIIGNPFLLTDTLIWLTDSSS